MDATRDMTTERSVTDDARPPALGLRPPGELADLIGGRLLAWIGGVAVAIGLVLLAVMASAGHHLGVPERLGLAGGGSLMLMAAGIWLHERRGRTEASIVAVGAATVGMFVVLAVCARTQTIPAAAAIAGSLLVGGTAAGLATRWAGQAIGWLGLLGAVVAPLAAGPAPDAATLGLLAVALVALLTTAVWRRWSWLALAGLVLAMPQWLWWCAGSRSVAGQLLVLAGFAGLGLVAAVAERRRHRGTAISAPAAALLAFNALATGVLGRLLLGHAAGSAAGDLWLAGLGAAHLALGSLRRLRVGIDLRGMLLAAGFGLLDVAFSLAFSGVALAAGWAAAAIGFAWLRRRIDDRRMASAPRRPVRIVACEGSGTSAIDLGIGVHLALVLIRVVLVAPPDRLAGGDGAVAALATTVALAAACFAGAWLTGPRRQTVTDLLNGLGLAAIAYLTAQSLHGPALVAAWTAEAVALAQFARRPGAQLEHARLLRAESLAFLALALAHVLIVDAPPTDLIGGSPAFWAAGIALGVLAVGAIRAGLSAPRSGACRAWLLTGGAAAVLYLLSVAIITLFQPALGALGAFGGAVIELSVRQQGQVTLSVVWGLIGLGGVIVGLRRHQELVRNVALGLLLVAVTKVFTYDLSTLTSIYRVASLLGFGLVLLASGFAYQRLRPRRA